MTIDEAIKALGLMLTPHKDAQLPMDEAIQLGIEALKRIKQLRDFAPELWSTGTRLPSESEGR